MVPPTPGPGNVILCWSELLSNLFVCIDVHELDSVIYIDIYPYFFPLIYIITIFFSTVSVLFRKLDILSTLIYYAFSFHTLFLSFDNWNLVFSGCEPVCIE